MRNIFGFILLALTLSFDVMAQELVATNHFLEGNFFPTVLAGVILALAFQFILTALSVAIGITSMGDLKQQYAEATQNLSQSGDPNERLQHIEEVSTNLGVKVTTGFGIWSVLTSCLALFAASTVALNLNGITTQAAVITHSLVIWALFFIILFYLESKIASSLIGGLIGVATSGLKASGFAVHRLFTPSDQKKVDQFLKTSIDRIRTEFNDIDYSSFNQAIDRFMLKVDKKIPDYQDLREDIMEAAQSSASRPNPTKWLALEAIMLKALDRNSQLNTPEAKEKVAQVKEIMVELKEAYNNGNTRTEGLKNIVAKFSDLDREEIDQKMAHLKDFLSNALPDDFDKEEFKEKLVEMIKHPKLMTQAMSNQFKGLDRESIIAYLNENTGLNKDQLETYADKVEAIIQRVSDEFDKENEERLTARIEARVANFFDSTGRPELQYDHLKNDFVEILDNPRNSLTVIKERANQMDANTFRALITNNRYIDQSDLDRIVEKYEEAKAYVLEKLAKIEEKTKQQYKMLKRKAVIKAEHARKTASVAAWWLVTSAVASAGAAVAGGLI